MNDLTSLIEKLPRERALEAAHNLTLQVSQNASPDERKEELVKPFIDKPFDNTQEIEQLARLILLTAAANPETVDLVRSVIKEADSKQMIYGDVETIVLAILGLFALNLLVKKSSQPRAINIEEADGKTTFVIDNQVLYGISPSLGQILKLYFGRH